RLLGRAGGKIALVEHAERAGGYAVAAAVADVFLDDDGAELRPEERSRRTDVEAGGVGAVLTDVGAHQPAKRVVAGRVEPRLLAVEPQRLSLLGEGNVAPGVGAEVRGVVVRLPRPDQAVLGDEVPFLAGDLAGLAADADGGVGEEAHPRLRLVAVGVRPGGGAAGDLRDAHPLPSSGSTRGACERA